MATLEDKPPPTPCSSSTLLILQNVTLCGMECPFCQFGSAVPAASPPSLLPTPSPHADRAEWENEETLNPVQALFSHSQKVDVLSAPFQPQV